MNVFFIVSAFQFLANSKWLDVRYCDDERGSNPHKQGVKIASFVAMT